MKIETNFHQECVAIKVNAMEKISVKAKYAKVSNQVIMLLKIEI
jgi:hypothetical protein